MANVEAPVNDYRSSTPVQGFVSQASEITGNVIELAELQVQLAKEDAAEAIAIAVKPMFTVGAAAVLLLASLPVLLMGIAGLLARYSGLDLEIAQLIVGVVASLLAVIIVFTSIKTMKSTLEPFNRSAKEFKQNITWLKTIFRSANP